MSNDLSNYFDPMDPGFPDRGTQAEVDAYLQKRKDKGLLTNSSWVLAGKTRTEVVANRTKSHLQAEVSRLQAEVDRLQNVIDRAKDESELIIFEEKPRIAVPYWFIKA